MADSIILSDGINDFEFVYDAQTQNDFKVHYGVKIEAGEPEPTWHTPDSAPPSLIRLRNNNRTIFLTKNVYGDNWDDVINTLVPIKRLIDGEDQQAARYHTDGDVDKVYLRIQLDGMTRYTDATVIYGFVDDSGSYYTPPAILNKQALGVVVMLVVEPLGEGAPITLRNDLPSSPHFVEDSNSDGLADGWNIVGTVGSNSIATSPALIGGKSQAVQATSQFAGLRSDAVTASISSNIAAKIFINISEVVSGRTVGCALVDGSNTVIQSKTIDPSDTSAAHAVHTASDGSTWYEIRLSGVNSGAANCKLQTLTQTALFTKWYIDGAYIYVGSTTVPDGWCSTCAIENRYDPNASNESRINYVDVWGVPGDSNAVVNLNVDATSGTNVVNLLSRFSGNNVNSVLYWRESDEYSSVTGTWTAGTGTTDNHYFRLASASASGLIENAQGWQHLSDSAVRVFVIGRSSSTTPTVQVKIAAGSASFGGSVIAETEAVSVSTANTWELMSLGVINLIQYTDGTNDLYEQVAVDSAGGQTVDIDAVVFVPIRDEFLVVTIDDKSGAASSTNDFVTDGRNRSIRGFDGLRKEPNGSLWYARPYVMNRYIWMAIAASSAITITTAATFSFTVYPRTRHLLGTA